MRETCGFENGVKCIVSEMSIIAITGYCLENEIKASSGKKNCILNSVALFSGALGQIKGLKLLPSKTFS